MSTRTAIDTTTVGGAGSLGAHAAENAVGHGKKTATLGGGEQTRPAKLHVGWRGERGRITSGRGLRSDRVHRRVHLPVAPAHSDRITANQDCLEGAQKHTAQRPQRPSEIAGSARGRESPGNRQERSVRMNKRFTPRQGRPGAIRRSGRPRAGWPGRPLPWTSSAIWLLGRRLGVTAGSGWSTAAAIQKEAAADSCQSRGQQLRSGFERVRQEARERPLPAAICFRWKNFIMGDARPPLGPREARPG